MTNEELIQSLCDHWQSACHREEYAAIVSALRDAERLKVELRHAQSRLIDELLKQALSETKEVRRRLLESEHIPPEIWEMRLY